MLFSWPKIKVGESKKRRLFLPPLLQSAKIELSFLRETDFYYFDFVGKRRRNKQERGDAEKGNIFLIVVLELTCQSIHMFSKLINAINASLGTSELNIRHTRLEPYVPFTKTSFLPNHFVELIGRVKAGSTKYDVIFGTKCNKMIFALKVIEMYFTPSS